MPASHAPSDRPNRGAGGATPRPHGATLDAIEREGISWEGPVVIVGHDGDIPARLFVTSERLILTSRDTILLEAPRSWLVPAPLRVQESSVRFSITPEGVVPGRATTERLLLEIGEGRGPAAQLIAIVTGRARKQRIEAEFPTWSAGVGAGRASSLPPLPAFESTRDEPPRQRRDTADPETRGVAPIDGWDTGEPVDAPGRPRIPFRSPEPEPVEPRSRAARFLTTRELPPEPVVADPSDEAPARITAIEPERRSRRTGAGIWAARVAMIAIVALVAGWFARPYLPDEVIDRLPAVVDGDEGDDVAMNPASSSGNDSTASQGDGTNGAGSDPADIMPTEAALGVGGATTDISEPGPTGAPQVPEETLTENPPAQSGQDEGQAPADSGQEPPAATEPATTGEGGTGDGEVTVATEAVAPEPTQPPVVAETQAPVSTEPPVVEASEPPIVVAPEEPIATETPVMPLPTQEPVVETPVATEIPATTDVAPPDAPVTEKPVTVPPVTVPPATQAAETPAPTEVPAAPTLEAQAASVSPEQPPAQQFVASGIRYSVEGAARGSSLPELPQVAEVSYGEWVVLALEARNQTGEEQTFDMREFTLLADGQPIQLDVGNSWVASLMGYSPAYGNTDATLWAAGEEHQFVLTFLAPPDAQSLVLQAGDQQFDLATLLETTPSLAEMQEAQAPETLEATVVEVIDGETIVIEKDGIRQTVRYLGIDVPPADGCQGSESTEANRALVEGRTVRIERQATDVDARGNWVRDVWVQQDDGTWVLVAHQLVQGGAATADISQPNTRFSSWLRGAEAAALAEGRGLWGACEQGTG